MPLEPGEERTIWNLLKSSTPAEGVPVNPKGYFANERTFLHWLSLNLILGALGIGLLNFSDMFGQIAGTLFTSVSLGFTFYALVQYHLRADMLSKKSTGVSFEDISGALLMVCIVFVAIGINFGLHFMDH